ncbi:MAG: alpha/beta hydrolase [Acidobacteriota bacterium]|nr:alpha/beta hydrolase [Acidobacteriota bacterium]
MFKKKRYWVLIIYVALLAASFAVRFWADPAVPSAEKKLIEISDGSDAPVSVAYLETANSNGAKQTVVMVHGSPGSAEAFDGLTRQFPGRHIIAVDLPGFGDSDRDVPDYSILAHAKYLNAFLSKKGISKAHFVGFSLGGGVIAQSANLNPQLIQSITFISSVGVQEYELFGDYYLNHAVHGLQLGIAWLLQEFVPHFGYFDGGLIEYSRNFYDTDQRPLREILQNYAGPMLILHGKDDPLVPVEAARETARIVPQSEYHELDDNHFFVFMRPGTISARMNQFWKRVENGEGVSREGASVSRVAAAAGPFEFKVIPAKGPAIFCFLLLILFVALANEDMAAVVAGVFIAQGRFGFVLPLIAFSLAVLVSGLFWRRIGRRRRGITLSASFPFSVDSRKADAFGFRFLSYIKRSRDSFFHFIGVSIGLGLLRAVLIGGAVYLIMMVAVFSGFIRNSNTLLLLALGFSAIVVKALGSLYFRSRRSR